MSEDKPPLPPPPPFSTTSVGDYGAAIWQPPSGGMFIFCPPVPPNTEFDKQMLHAASFDNITTPFYPQTAAARWPATAQDGATVFPEQKWDNPAMYPFPFHTSEQYPSDPFPSTPSTSMAQAPFEYKPQPYYPLLPNGYVHAPQTDYAQMFNNWKVPSMKPSSKHTPNPPYRTGPGTNNVRVRSADKYRMVYTEYQRVELEKEFHTQNFVTSDRKAELSTLLNLTERQIKIWFQNRRAKERRDKKK